VYRLLVGKPGGKSPLGRPRHSWEDNIKVDVLEIVWGDVDWACSTNGGEEERVYVVGGKARGKEITKKTKTWFGG
jgi:hypothetical protein